MKDIINKTIEVLANGGVILYPTDTIWGIGCDATNAEAVKRIFHIKQREESKSMIVLVANDRQFQTVFEEVPPVAWDLIDFAEKPLSLILDNPKNVAHNLIASDNTLAIRKITQGFCNQLLTKFNKPLVSTSANFSGHTSPTCFNDIPTDLCQLVDYIVPIDQDKKAQYTASTIIKLGNNSEIKIIRK